MNSTINKIFCTSSGELLFLRYNKICKKAVIKLGSFLQCLVHIFLGHDDCVRKTNLRILWNHYMKNFQVKHGQCSSIIFPQNIFFWRIYRVFQIAVKGGGGGERGGFIPSQGSPPFCTLQKRPSSILHFGQIRIYLTLNWKETLLICFESCQDVLYYPYD